jgi:hypothetical protein
VAPAAAQGSMRDVILAWFPDGAGVELYTETTGSRQQTSLQGAGMIAYNQVHRIVSDNQNRIVFAYELEAERAPEPGAITIRLQPVSPEVAGHMPENGRFLVDAPGGRIPTLSGVREFRSVKRGEEVKIEILANPATGEKVYDVLRPTDEPKPYPGGPVIRSDRRPVGGTTAPQEVRVVVNGQALAVRSSWTAGKPARFYLPGHGAYYLSWGSLPNFRLAGYIEKNRLIFLLDSKYVEITCLSNILTTAERGPVWVYHDPDYTPEPRDGTVHGAELTSAGNLEAVHEKRYK